MTKQTLDTTSLKSGSDTGADYYKGTKEQLVSAGVCKREWFPRKLLPEFCKDGRPKIGNSGHQRFKRTYAVHDQQPEIVLTHRTDSEGREYWVVRKAVAENESLKRKAEQKAEWAAQQQRVDEAQRRQALEAQAAQPIVSQLWRRYPDLLQIQGSVSKGENGTRSQVLSFYSRDIETLKRMDLVTDGMLDDRCKEKHFDNWFSGNLPNGDRFSLRETETQNSKYWTLNLYMSDSVRERKHFPMAEARNLLKLIAARS